MLTWNFRLKNVGLALVRKSSKNSKIIQESIYTFEWKCSVKDLNQKGEKKMKNKNLKMAKIGLVTLLLVVGFSSVLANATYHSDPIGFNSVSSYLPVILTIDSPSDGTSFVEPWPLQTIYVSVHIVNQFGSPISDATVHTYPGQSQNYQWRGFTDKNGIAYWPEPNVDLDTIYRVKAEKFVNGDYQESTIYITIRNRYLKVSTNVNPVDEGKEFFGIATDQDNQPVAMAAVKFNGKTKFTDINGMTSSFTAPWITTPSNTSQISGSKNYPIEASAPLRGYDDGKSTVTVRDTGYPKSHKIYGQVRDYDFVPLQNVKITTNKGNYVYTDKNGDYSFEIVPKEGGEYIAIMASYSGFITQSERIWVSSTDTNPIHLNFWLVQDGKVNQNAQGQQQIQEQQSQKTDYQQVNYS